MFWGDTRMPASEDGGSRNSSKEREGTPPRTSSHRSPKGLTGPALYARGSKSNG